MSLHDNSMQCVSSLHCNCEAKVTRKQRDTDTELLHLLYSNQAVKLSADLHACVMVLRAA